MKMRRYWVCSPPKLRIFASMDSMSRTPEIEQGDLVAEIGDRMPCEKRIAAQRSQRRIRSQHQVVRGFAVKDRVIDRVGAVPVVDDPENHAMAILFYRIVKDDQIIQGIGKPLVLPFK